jgi:hypothetical protein
MNRSFTTFAFHPPPQGSIHGRAYCHPKDSYGAAIAALKADIGKSLAARFDFLCEELERRESDLKERKKKASSGMRVCGACGREEEVRAVCVCVRVLCVCV